MEGRTDEMGEHPLDTPYQDEEEEELDDLRCLFLYQSPDLHSSQKK